MKKVSVNGKKNCLSLKLTQMSRMPGFNNDLMIENTIYYILIFCRVVGHNMTKFMVLILIFHSNNSNAGTRITAGCGKWIRKMILL